MASGLAVFCGWNFKVLPVHPKVPLPFGSNADYCAHVLQPGFCGGRLDKLLAGLHLVVSEAVVDGQAVLKAAVLEGSSGIWVQRVAQAAAPHPGEHYGSDEEVLVRPAACGAVWLACCRSHTCCGL